MVTTCSENLDENTPGKQFLPALGCGINKPKNVLVCGKKDNQYFVLFDHVVFKCTHSSTIDGSDPTANFAKSLTLGC